MIAWFAENMVWASAAMLVVLAVRRPVARLFGAGVAYALWLIPLVRLIAPPAAWISGLFDNQLPSLPPLLLTIEHGVGAAPPPLGGPGQWVPILLAVWAGGVLLFLIFQAFGYRRFLKRLSLSMRNAGDHEGVPLIESAAVDGPLALGLIDRRIVVPPGFETRYTPAEQRLALDHERYHHRRGDILANHVALLILALNWFNPIAWASFRAFRSDQELSCDAAIAAAADPQVRADYARALVKSASRPGLIAACPLNGADQLKWRLKMLNHHKKDWRRAWAGGAATVGLVAGSLVLGSPGIAQQLTAPLSAIEQRGADTNRAPVAAPRQRQADIARAAETAPAPRADKQRSRDSIALLDEKIQEVQGRTADPERQRVIILERPKGAAPPTDERREFRLRRGEDGKATIEGLPPQAAAQFERCNAQDEVINVESGSGKERDRILVCTKDGADPANRLQILQNVRERMSKSTDLKPETKERMLAEIDRAIAAAAGN